MAHIRKQMILGLWPRECQSCKLAEATGIGSHREGVNIRYSQLFQELKADPLNVEPTLTSLDLRISNKCNFSCRSCSGHLSSAWRDDHNAIYQKKISTGKSYNGATVIGIEYQKEFWQQLDSGVFQQLVELNFAGGEALLVDKHYEVLEKLSIQGRFNLALTYTTNLSVLQYKRWDLIELWKPFKNVTLHISIDGVGEKGEYIRNGLNWQRWLEHFRKIKAVLPHVKLDLHFVVSVFNILDLREHFDSLIDLDLIEVAEAGNYKIAFTCLEQPAYLSIQALHPDLKREAEKRINAMVEQDPRMNNHLSNTLKGLIKHMYAEDLYMRNRQSFVHITRLLDKRRKQDYGSLFPELAIM